MAGRWWPSGLLGAIAVAAGVEIVLSLRANELTAVTPARWAYSRAKAAGEGPKADLLLLGSSLVKFDLHPAVITAVTGLKAFNLAVYGGRMASTYYVLKRALDAGARPTALVIDCHDGPEPVTPEKSPAEAIVANRRNWPELIGPVSAADLALQAADPEFFGDTALASALPSLRLRGELRDGLTGWFGGAPREDRAPYLSLFRNWDANRGTQLMPETWPLPARAEVSDMPPLVVPAELPPGRYTRNHVMEEYARRVLDLAEGLGIPVFWVFPPMTPGSQANQDLTGTTRFSDRFVMMLQREYPDLVVADARRSFYPLRTFSDKTHLSEVGVVCLSLDLGRLIHWHLAGRTGPYRWHNLPAFRDEPRVPGVENYYQSLLAVKAGAATATR